MRRDAGIWIRDPVDKGEKGCAATSRRCSISNRPQRMTKSKPPRCNSCANSPASTSPRRPMRKPSTAPSRRSQPQPAGYCHRCTRMRRRATARSRPRRRATDGSSGLAEMRPARRGGAFLESRYRAGAVARSSLLLVLVLVLFLFLVLAVMVVIIVVTGFIVVFGRFQRLALGGFAFLGLLCFTLARSLVVFIGIEQQVQPRHHLFDRRQLPGRAGFAARTGFASCAGLALRASLAARPLRTGLARRPRLAARTFRSGPSGMALRSGPTRFGAWALAAPAG